MKLILVMIWGDLWVSQYPIIITFDLFAATTTLTSLLYRAYPLPIPTTLRVIPNQTNPLQLFTVSFPFQLYISWRVLPLAPSTPRATASRSLTTVRRCKNFHHPFDPRRRFFPALRSLLYCICVMFLLTYIWQTPSHFRRNLCSNSIMSCARPVLPRHPSSRRQAPS